MYEGVYKLSQRDVSSATELFLSAVATFTCFELISYENLIAYTVLTSMITLDRASLKEKVVKNSDVLSTIGKIPYLSELLHAFYECRYRDFFVALVGIDSYVIVFSADASYFVRELRIIAPSSFFSLPNASLIDGSTTGVMIFSIASYLVLSVSSVLLRRLTRLRVRLINRPDAKNAQYNDIA